MGRKVKNPKTTSGKRALCNKSKRESKRRKVDYSSIVETLRKRESQLIEQGFKYVVGTDEAGRGPLAGPVVAAACYVPPGIVVAGVGDSKALTEEQREECFKELTTNPKILYGVSIQDNHVIDRINILAASLLAMVESVAQIKKNKLYVLVDGNRDPPFPENIPFETVVKGDSKCYCIAAASIIAKVTRDHIMEDLDKRYPQYLLAKHKGYGTASHKALVHKYGPSPIHRITFAPIKNMKGIDLTGTYIDPVNVEKRRREKKEQGKLAKNKKLSRSGKNSKKLTDFFSHAKAV